MLVMLLCGWLCSFVCVLYGESCVDLCCQQMKGMRCGERLFGVILFSCVGSCVDLHLWGLCCEILICAGGN